MANTCPVLESVIEKMQFYPTLTNVKETQDFVMILGVLKDLYFPLGTEPPFLISPGKESTHMGLGIKTS